MDGVQQSMWPAGRGGVGKGPVHTVYSCTVVVYAISLVLLMMYTLVYCIYRCRDGRQPPVCLSVCVSVCVLFDCSTVAAAERCRWEGRGGEWWLILVCAWVRPVGNCCCCCVLANVTASAQLLCVALRCSLLSLDCVLANIHTANDWYHVMAKDTCIQLVMVLTFSSQIMLTL